MFFVLPQGETNRLGVDRGAWVELDVTVAVEGDDFLARINLANRQMVLPASLHGNGDSLTLSNHPARSEGIELTQGIVRGNFVMEVLGYKLVGTLHNFYLFNATSGFDQIFYQVVSQVFALNLRVPALGR